MLTSAIWSIIPSFVPIGRYKLEVDFAPFGNAAVIGRHLVHPFHRTDNDRIFSFWRTIRRGITLLVVPESIVMPLRSLNRLPPTVRAACWFVHFVTGADSSIVLSSITGGSGQSTLHDSLG